jgi:signal transduction histidine kinase
MGIGLLIVQAIAQAYKGYAAIEETSDKGTTMVIGFPAGEEL